MVILLEEAIRTPEGGKIFRTLPDGTKWPTQSPEKWTRDLFPEDEANGTCR